MRRMIRRAVGMFRRPQAAGPFVMFAGESPASAAPQVKPAVVDGRVVLDGVSFALVERVEDFMAAVPTERRIALSLRTSDYEQVYHRDVRAGFDSAYAQDSAEYKAFYSAQLCCAGCGREFPGSFTMSLIGMFDSDTRISGATSGFDKFGRTGQCTRCASKTSLLAYECYPPAEIGEDDVAALRQYWRDSAIRWWADTGRRGGLCDLCSTPGLTRKDSYLVSGGTYMICPACLEERLAGALERLRESPYYFGASELRRARRNRHAVTDGGPE